MFPHAPSTLGSRVTPAVERMLIIIRLNGSVTEVETKIRKQVKRLLLVSEELSVILYPLCRLQKDSDSKRVRQRGRQKDPERDEELKNT